MASIILCRDLFGRQAGLAECLHMDSARPWVKGRLLAEESVKNLFFVEEV